jgi:hypothetical protein
MGASPMGPVFKSLFLGWPELEKTLPPPPSPELEKSVRLAGSTGMSATRFIFVTGARITTKNGNFTRQLRYYQKSEDLSRHGRNCFRIFPVKPQY